MINITVPFLEQIERRLPRLAKARGIPSVATGDQAQETLSRLVEISDGMNSAFELRDGKAYISPVE